MCLARVGSTSVASHRPRGFLLQSGIGPSASACLANVHNALRACRAVDFRRGCQSILELCPAVAASAVGHLNLWLTALQWGTGHHGGLCHVPIRETTV